MQGRSRSVAISLAAVAFAGCHRGPNIAAVAGIRVAPAGFEPGSEVVEGESNAGFLGEVGGTARVYELGDGLIGRGGLDVFVGGNTSGPAAELSGSLGAGPALMLEEEHALFTRAAVDFDLERNPYSGLVSLELPALEGGYAFHGKDDGHIELYGRVGLATAGVTYAREAKATFVASPEVGGGAVVYGPGLSAEVTYTHVFEGPPVDLWRSMGCVGFGLVVCGDARISVATFVDEAGDERTLQGYYGGVTFGMGMVWGRE